MKDCKSKDKFITSEVASLARLRTVGAINEFGKITNLSLFRKLNSEWSEYAKQWYDVTERLFYEEGEKVYANKSAFKKIDNTKIRETRIAEWRDKKDVQQQAQELIDEDVTRLGMEDEIDYRDVMYQKPSKQLPSASPKTISIIRDLLKRMGVDEKKVREIVVDGEVQNAQGVALLGQRLIQVVEGKEAESLPEEGMHFAVAIVKQTNPRLYAKLLSEINGSTILTQTFKDYSDDKKYQINGKPDVSKIKEEAIGKKLAEVIINKTLENDNPSFIEKVNNWWKQIVQHIKNLIAKSGFDQLAMDIITGKDIGTAEDILEGGEFYQLDKQTSVYNNIKAVSAKIEKKNNDYYIDGKKIAKRVSNFVEEWYKLRFGDGDLTKSEWEKAVDASRAEKGTQGHGALEYAFSRMVDEDGYLRAIPLEEDDYSIINPNFSKEMYDLLRDNLKQRLDTFPKGTRFMSEATIYNGRNVAGTVDFLAIEPTGKTHILDWKFVNLKTEQYDDIPWYKVGAWKLQMGWYKKILTQAYGLKNEQFGQTRMIPIQAKYSKGNAKQNILPKLTEVKIGDVNVKAITEDYLLPVGLTEEKTGNKQIDKLIEKLNDTYKKFEQQKVLPEDKKRKAEQLNAIFKAIRHLQIKGDLNALVIQAKVLNKQVEQLIQEFESKYKDVDPTQLTEEDNVAINSYFNKILDSESALETYIDLDIELNSFFEGTLSEEDKELKKDIRETVDDARLYKKKLKDTIEGLIDVVAKSEGVNNYLSPEKVIKGFPKWFGSTSKIQMSSLHLLYRKANKALGFAAMDTVNETKKLQDLKDKYDEWAKSKGLTKKNYFSLIKKSDKNELIDEYNVDFYKTLRQSITNKDYKWIRENVDVEKYREHLANKLAKEIEWTKELPLTEDQIKNKIKKLEALYSISSPESVGWLLLKEVRRFPKDSWKSKEWVELHKPENSPALNFYNYIVEKNNEYREFGYIAGNEARTFLPFIPKGLMEKVIVGGNLKVGENFLRAISVDEGDYNYGQRDPLTGKLVDIVPKYFITEIDGDVSEDLFHNMALYNETAIRYKYVTNIEGVTRAMLNVERNKNSIATSVFGRTQYKDGELEIVKNNEENSKLLNNMVKAIIYGQRYIEDETFDQLLFKVGGWGKVLNEKLGTNVFPEDLAERQVSINKAIDGLNSIFQMNSLGLNVLSAGSNFFGGHVQSIINSGKYFTKADHLAAEFEIAGNKFKGKDAKKHIGALEYFLPLTENYNRELAKKLSIVGMTEESLQDGLFYFMRQTDWNVQSTNFFAYLKNTIVQDGQVINAREYLRSTEKYKNRYRGTEAERKQLKEEFEKDVKDLIEEKGVMNIAQIVDDKFVIPGVDQHSQSVINLRRTVQQINKNALGNMSADDVRNINLRIYGKSFMLFKNWIPPLMDVRIGNLKYDSARDAYEWGRTRMLFRIISEEMLGSVGKLHDSLQANDKGIEYMRDLYQRKKEDYEKDTGKELLMSEEDFMDLVRNNIKAQIMDVVAIVSLSMLIVAAKALAPDDDEDPAIRSQYRFMLKAMDKFRSELLYFYDPTSLSGLFSTGIFPAMGFITNFTKAWKNFVIENWAIFTDNETLQKDTQVIKYWMKSFPIANQIVGYLPMFYPDIAKDLGVRIQSNYGIK